MIERYPIYLSAILALGCIRQAPAQQSHPSSIAVHSVSVDLPASQASFPLGPGSEIAGKCLICHSAGMVLQQPLLKQAEWVTEINKMRNAYGAPISEDEVGVLSTYLSKINADQQIK